MSISQHRGFILMLYYLYLTIVHMVSPFSFRCYPSLWLRIHTHIRCAHFRSTWNQYQFYTIAGAYWCFGKYTFALFLWSLHMYLRVIRVSDSESKVRFDVNILEVPETNTNFTPSRVHIDALVPLPSHCFYCLSIGT